MCAGMTTILEWKPVSSGVKANAVCSVISRPFMPYIVLFTHKYVHLHSNHTTERRRLAHILLASSSSSSPSQQEVIELEQHIHTWRERERRERVKEGEKMQNNYKDCHFLFCRSCSRFQLQQCHASPAIWFGAGWRRWILRSSHDGQLLLSLIIITAFRCAHICTQTHTGRLEPV